MLNTHNVECNLAAPRSWFLDGLPRPEQHNVVITALINELAVASDPAHMFQDASYHLGLLVHFS